MVTLERTKSQEVRSFFADFFNFLIGFVCGWLESFLQRDNFWKTKPPKVDNLLQLICKTDRPERSTEGTKRDGRTDGHWLYEPCWQTNTTPTQRWHADNNNNDRRISFKWQQLQCYRKREGERKWEREQGELWMFFSDIELRNGKHDKKKQSANNETNWQTYSVIEGVCVCVFGG